jgi:hypothetical protein
MKELYFPIPVPFSIDLDLKKFTDQQTKIQLDLLPQWLHQWIKDKINATVLWTEVFYLPPYRTYDIHCDGHEIDNKCKLNYIVNGDDSNIIWYEAINKNKIISAYSKSNTKYLKLDQTNSRELSRVTLTNLNLVNVGEFHTVVNGKNHRWCISIVIGDNISKKRLDFDEVKTRLNLI